MADKKYYWLKLKEDFFRQLSMKKLRKIAGGDVYTIIYLKMMLVAMKQSGKIHYNCEEDEFIENLALDIDEDADNVKITVMFLEKEKLLEKLNDGTSYLPAALECVGKEGASAERMRKLRAKKEHKKLASSQSDNDVQKSDTEIEKEQQLQLEQQKKTNNKKDDPFVAFAGDDQELLSLLNDFEAMRKQIKKPMTKRAKELLISKLKKDFPIRDMQIATLSQSVMNCWQGLYDVKEPLRSNSAHIDYDYGELGVDHL